LPSLRLLASLSLALWLLSLSAPFSSAPGLPWTALVALSVPLLPSVRALWMFVSHNLVECCPPYPTPDRRQRTPVRVASHPGL